MKGALRAVSVGLVAAGTSLGCVAESAPVGTVAFADSAGVQVVTSSSPERGGSLAWTLAPTPRVEIGEESGAPEVLFDGVVGAARMNDGTLLVCDGGSRTLRSFAADGTAGRIVVPAGDGPGELRRLTSCPRRGEEVWAVQVPALPIKVFSGDGELLRTVAIPRPSGRVALVLDVYADGGLLLRQDDPRNALGEGRSPLSGVLLRMEPTKADPDTLGRYLTGLWVRSDRVAFPAAFSPALWAVGMEGGTVVSWSETFDAEWMDHAGVVVRRMRRAGEPSPVTAADRAAFADRILHGPMPGGDVPYNSEEVRREIVDITRYPEIFPAHYRMMASLDGTLWIERGDGPRDPLPQVAEPFDLPTTWDVFSADGPWITTVRLPARFDPLEVAGDYVLGIAHDALGVERLQLYDLIKPTG